MDGKTSRVGLTVVVTGASSGFGKGMAQKLASQGANVVLAARRTALIEELAEQLGPNALAVTTDISNERDIAHLMEEALRAFGKVDVWINNAGLGIIGPFTEVPLTDQRRLVEVNLLGTVYGSHHAMRHFLERGRGTLINLSSFVYYVPLPYGAVYSATKFGISALTQGLYQEMELEGRKDIHVCAVHPWVTDTPWTYHAGNYSGHSIDIGPADDPEKVIDEILGLIDSPKETLEIGFKVKGAIFAHRLMPELTEKLDGQFLMKMLQNSPYTPATSGSLFEPQPEGTEVSGDLRERWKHKQPLEKKRTGGEIHGKDS
ncbi:SDR family NAD(P)-dependent oxidoreductase [Planococcus sp. FY231025]|uniref:SDR family NAD(P)-dependent oxidoreductase n=1 Tax=Planococcus sp. FY231025 TaxID=3455699 RepID=UPI003F911E97